jgi:hypothetical protein
MHGLHKVSKANASTMAVRDIPWVVLNFLAFTALSLWIGFRGVCNAISHRRRRK